MTNATLPQKPPKESAQHRHVLHVMAALYGWKTFIEVGVWKGDTGAYLLDMVPDLVWYGIDPYAMPAGDMSEPGAWDMSRFNLEQVYQRTLHRMIGTYGNHRAILLRKTSLEGVASLTFQADAVFIDGDHRFDHVREDLLAWWPKVASGGWLLGHDYDMPSVRKAVADVTSTLKTGPAITLPDRVFAIFKR